MRRRVWGLFRTWHLLCLDHWLSLDYRLRIHWRRLWLVALSLRSRRIPIDKSIPVDIHRDEVWLSLHHNWLRLMHHHRLRLLHHHWLRILHHHWLRLSCHYWLLGVLSHRLLNNRLLYHWLLNNILMYNRSSYQFLFIDLIFLRSVLFLFFRLIVFILFPATARADITIPAASKAATTANKHEA